MKTNINIDNYEAYLLDYLDGNLSPDEAEQLKAFVVAQGLDWNELTEDLPVLEAPGVTYQDKESLKKKGAVIPFYVKVASVAAAAGLLLTVTLWPEKSMPTLEPVAELKPILPTRLITADESPTLPPRTVSFVSSPSVTKKQPKAIRTEAVLLADLQPVKASEAQISSSTPIAEEPYLELIAYCMSSYPTSVSFDENEYAEELDEERELSFIDKGVLWLTNGRHDNFDDIVFSSVRKVKQDLTEVATDMALAVYQRAEDDIEEVKERWEERHER